MNTNTRSRAPSNECPTPEYQPWVAKISDINELLVLPTVPDAAKQGAHVLVTTKFGTDCAVLLGPCASDDLEEADTAEFLRPMSEEEVQSAAALVQKAKETEDIFRQHIEAHRLPMKPICAHYLFQEEKLLLFFTADGRVDFRELVRDLVAIFRLRIELRQIGVRDESRMLGGLGVCGRGYCCNNIAARLPQVSIKMAKTQNLSLSSNKISGACGRLLCCLAFENEAYAMERCALPAEGDKILGDKSAYRVYEVNAIGRYLLATAQDGSQIKISGCQVKSAGTRGIWDLLAAPNGCGCAFDDDTQEG